MRSNNITLEKVGPANLSDCGIGCLKNRKNEGFQRKVQWLRRRFNEGLRCFLFRDEDGKPLVFLEYVPGEHAWRPVDAAGWLFMHCLWVNLSKTRFKNILRQSGLSRRIAERLFLMRKRPLDLPATV